MKPGITPVTAVTSVIVGEANKQINVSGRLSFQGPKETVLTKGKTLQKQKALFTDNTGTVRFVSMGKRQATRIISGSSYKLSNVMVREYDHSKYLTLNKKSTIEEIEDAVDRQDEINIDNNLSGNSPLSS